MPLTTTPLGQTGNRGSLWNRILTDDYSFGSSGISASTLTSVAGTMSKASQERYESKLKYAQAEHSLDFNILMADHEAKMVTLNEEIESEKFRRKFDSAVGAAKAVSGAQGFAIDSQTTQRIIDDSVRAGEFDAAIIRMNGDIGRWKVEISKIESQYQKKLLGIQKNYDKKMQIASTIYSIANTALSAYGSSSTGGAK